MQSNLIMSIDTFFYSCSYHDKSGKIICVLRPKKNKNYLEYLGISVFGNKKSFDMWYDNKNYFYGDKSPAEMTISEAINLLSCIITGTII